jgi:nitroreductase
MNDHEMLSRAPAGQALSPDELLTQTRSVRRRLDFDRGVDLGLVRDCLRVALQAPNGGNAQRWRWLVVADSGLRASIAEWYRMSWDQYVRVTPSATRRNVDSAAYLARNLARVPVLVIPCLELATEDLPPGSQAGLWASVLPAAWSYMLAARARGLGTAWTTLHLRYEREVAGLLRLPAHVRQAALIPTARFLGDSFQPGVRKPLEEVLHIDGWHGRSGPDGDAPAG